MDNKKKQKICPDYNPKSCITKFGVIVCWEIDHEKKYRCPIIDYEGGEEYEK